MEGWAQHAHSQLLRKKTQECKETRKWGTQSCNSRNSHASLKEDLGSRKERSPASTLTRA